MQFSAKDKIILALDVSTPEAARNLIRQVGPRVGLYKIGMQLFTQCGPDIVKEVRAAGAKVFLDLKFHDIPNTVRKAVESARSLGVDMLTIHLSGGPEMARAAAEGAGDSKMLVLGVTVLTSSNAATLRAVGIDSPVDVQALRLADIALEADLGGIVCSPLELGPMNARFAGTLKFVTPGVRPKWADPNDQKRVLTPREAVDAGAHYLVIGRPISGATDPGAAAERILSDIE